MTELNLNQLFDIAQASNLLDSIEESLRLSGQNDAADILVKLQQDCGVAIDQEMNDHDSIPAGPESAKLIAAYSPLTKKRVNECAHIIDKTPLNASLKKTFTDFLKDSKLISPAPPGQKSQTRFGPK